MCITIMEAASMDDNLSLFSQLRLSSDTVRKYECLICLELLFEPKLLQCPGFHTFCEKCLQKHIDRHSFLGPGRQESYFYCPACKGRVLVPQKGAKGFQTNYYISDEVDRLRAATQRECDICSSVSTYPGSGSVRKASFACSDCSNMLCKRCSPNHHMYFPSHSVQRLSLSTTFPSPDPQAVEASQSCQTRQKLLHSPGPERPSAIKCSAHPGEDLRFFCQGTEEQPCQTVICRDCRLTDHFHHSRVTDVTRMVERSREQLQQQEEQIQARIQALTARGQTLKAWEDGIVASKLEVRTLLQARAEQLISAITDHKEQAVSQLEATAEEEEGRVVEEMNLTRGARSSLEDMLATVQQAARAGSDVDKVRVSADMSRLLKKEEEERQAGAAESCQDFGGGIKGFLLNTSGPVRENVISPQLLDDLLGKVVKL